MVSPISSTVKDEKDKLERATMSRAKTAKVQEDHEFYFKDIILLVSGN